MSFAVASEPASDDPQRSTVFTNFDVCSVLHILSIGHPKKKAKPAAYRTTFANPHRVRALSQCETKLEASITYPYSLLRYAAPRLPTVFGHYPPKCVYVRLT